MIIVLGLLYLLIGAGAYTGYFHKEPLATDIFTIVSWPFWVSAMVVAALKKYLELK